MRLLCQRSTGCNLRSVAEPQQFPGADKIGPRTARVIGEPETVSGQNEMICADRWHCHFKRSRLKLVQWQFCGPKARPLRENSDAAQRRQLLLPQNALRPQSAKFR